MKLFPGPLSVFSYNSRNPQPLLRALSVFICFLRYMAVTIACSKRTCLHRARPPCSPPASLHCSVSIDPPHPPCGFAIWGLQTRGVDPQRFKPGILRRDFADGNIIRLYNTLSPVDRFHLVRCRREPFPMPWVCKLQKTLALSSH